MTLNIWVQKNLIILKGISLIFNYIYIIKIMLTNFDIFSSN